MNQSEFKADSLCFAGWDQHSWRLKDSVEPHLCPMPRDVAKTTAYLRRLSRPAARTLLHTVG